MSDGRVATAAGRLARLGFADADRTARSLERLGPAADDLVQLLAASADPDQAAWYLAELADHTDRVDLVRELAEDRATAVRLTTVLGASAALAEHVVRHPEHRHDLADPALGSTRPAAFALRRDLLTAVGADPASPEPVASGDDAACVNALRVGYRRLLLRLAARDLCGDVGVDDVAAELSDLAAGTLEAALAVARARLGDAAAGARLAVVAMGKCGGHELNYVSDVDVIFVAEPVGGYDEQAALRAATQLASNLMRICSDHTAEGTIWPVDAALRPEGRSGPLVRTLASHEAYYQKWAKTWEFQALLKARPVAGDLDLGREYVDRIAPLVWSASQREGFVTDVQAMRRRVLDNIPAAQADRQIKLGAGGLRDVEFAVQLLQLVHGRADETVRAPATLSALAHLTRGGYVGREDGGALDEAYRFLRTLEHRMQLSRLTRTHVLPGDEASLRRLGRSMGMPRDPVQQLDREWRRHSREVRRLHEKLFYRPLLAAVAKLPAHEARLSPQSAKQRLSALGYADPDAALRHLEALTSGVSRTASIQRALLPALLGWFADAPNPDAGLSGFRRISEALGSTHWYLQTLRDEGQVAQRLAMLLASSRYATDLLQRAPEGMRMLAADRDLSPLGRDALRKETLAAAERHTDPVEAVTAIRAIRRRELFRIASADLFGLLDVVDVGRALTDVTVATLEGALLVARLAVEAERRGPLPTRLAVVAMGRFGGGELGFGSDADVMFVHDPLPDASGEDAARAAKDVAAELTRLLSLPGTDPALQIDADLRPEGKQGPLVRTLDSYARYYDTWSVVWEAQALLRADAVIGDADLGRRFVELVDPLRFPEGGLSADDVLEVRRIKARVDDERLPRGADPATHLKLGRGGLADVEWTVQLLQMQHGARVPGLRTTRTLDALGSAVRTELLGEADADALATAWRTASGLRNAITQVRGRPADSLPSDTRDRAAVAHLRGYRPGESDQLVNDYLRVTRRARRVVERVFWG